MEPQVDNPSEHQRWCLWEVREEIKLSTEAARLPTGKCCTRNMVHRPANAAPQGLSISTVELE